MCTKVMQAVGSENCAWDLEIHAPAKSLSGMLVGVGRELRLFEALDALGDITGPALARCTGLDEGFLGEWLNAMVEMGHVEFDSTTARFAFPRQRVTRRGERQSGGGHGPMIELVGTAPAGAHHEP